MNFEYLLIDQLSCVVVLDSDVTRGFVSLGSHGCTCCIVIVAKYNRRCLGEELSY